MVAEMSGKVQSQRGAHELLLQAWECAFRGSNVVYLSGPITTGPRFLEWYSSSGRALADDPAAYQAALVQKVIQPNSQDIIETAIRLRSELHEPVLEPASLFIADWSQDEYLTLWDRVIERFAARIVVMPGWEFSAGCVSELVRAFADGLPVVTVDGAQLGLSDAIEFVGGAAARVSSEDIPVRGLSYSLQKLRGLEGGDLRHGLSITSVERLRKDASLDRLADMINVAQFVSFAPTRGQPKQQYARVKGFAPNHEFSSLRHALGTLLERSADGSINLRSFTPESPQSREFIYGIRSIEQALSSAERLSSEGLFVIANETVDIHDGGVSGVLMGDIIEFSPDDTPRGVEKPGVASLPRLWGIGMLSLVYGFAPDINVSRTSRLEFSIHPRPRGWKHTHTLGWEYEAADVAGLTPKLSWPNNFSRMIGDKVYGLLVAHFAGLPVPRTTVLSRRVPPFAFGRPTGSAEVWLRTSPTEQVPGKFTTVKGWRDPFYLMNREDPEGTGISSVLCQAAVRSKFAGAVIVSADGSLVVEGLRGEGDVFMQGTAKPEALPSDVRSAIVALHRKASQLLGPVRFEWVFDGVSPWIVQLHRGATQSAGNVIVPGAAEHWVMFNVEQGLEALRTMVTRLDPGAGLILKGEVGLTSHIADVVRKAGVPTRFQVT